MSKVDAALGALDRLRYPFDLAFEHTGQALAVAVRPATREPEQSYESRLWRVGIDGSARQISHGPGSDAMPRFAPADGRLAFASDRALPGRMALHLMAPDGAVRELGDVAGSVEDLQWSAQGDALFVLAADRGLDVAATDGAVRLWWGDPPDPEVSRPGEARRRLFRVGAADGSATEVGPGALSVWQFTLVDDAKAVALVSADPSAAGIAPSWRCSISPTARRGCSTDRPGSSRVRRSIPLASGSRCWRAGPAIGAWSRAGFAWSSWKAARAASSPIRRIFRPWPGATSTACGAPAGARWARYTA